MKVALFTDTYYPNVNGVVKTISRIEDYFKQEEIPYKVFCPGNRTENTNHHQFFLGTKFLLYPEIQLVMVPYLWFRNLVSEYKPDVIHIYTQGPIGYMALKYAKEYHIPFVCSYTTDFDSYLDFYHLELFTSQVNKYLYKIHSNAYTNLVPSVYSMEKLNEIGLNNLSLWGRGIDTNRFNPDFRDEKIHNTLANGGDLVLTYCGRLAKEKKINVLIDMIKVLNKRNRNVSLVIIGDGPQRNELEKDAPTNVKFMGYQSGETLSALYASSDVFVFASENETFGNVILEAFASNLPVISINRGGVKENLRHLENGIALEENTGEAFARAVEMLLDNPSMINQLAEKGLKLAKTKTWTSLMESLVTYYEEAIFAYGKEEQLA